MLEISTAFLTPPPPTWTPRVGGDQKSAGVKVFIAGSPVRYRVRYPFSFRRGLRRGIRDGSAPRAKPNSVTA